MIILFTELLRVWRDETRKQASVSREVQILELLAYIEKNYETCTLPQMGKAFGMHGNYLTALLKEKTGRSFVEHVQEQRLKKARTLLETTELPLSELIPLCGYNNMNFFTGNSARRKDALLPGIGKNTDIPYKWLIF